MCFPVLVCNSDLLSFNRFMSFEQQYTFVAFIIHQLRSNINIQNGPIKYEVENFLFILPLPKVICDFAIGC